MRVALLVICVIGLCLCSNSKLAEADEARRLRIMFVIDSPNAVLRGDDISGQCESAGEKLHAIFERHIPKEKFTYDQLNGDDASPENVIHEIKQLSVSDDENIFFFYCGHGGWDREKGQFLAMGRGNLYRSDLRKALFGKNARGVVILTDCCSTFQSGVPVARAMLPECETVADLFFLANGKVDITAASPGEAAWFTQNGGIFSNSLYETLMIPRKDGDTNGDGKLDWDEAFRLLKRKTSENFAYGKQSAAAGTPLNVARSQTPYRFVNK